MELKKDLISILKRLETKRKRKKKIIINIKKPKLRRKK